MTGPLAPPIAHPCPNCGADAPHAYCAHCGQAQHDRLRASLRALAAEGFEELTDLDAKLWTTLRLLVRRPGLLTREYLAGRRARYVRPLRLYLTASLVFFVAYTIAAGAAGDAGARDTVFGLQVHREPSADPAAAVPDAPAIAAPADDVAGDGPLTVGGDPGDSWLERAVEDRLARFARLSRAEQRRLVTDGVERHMPKAFFVLVPLFALLLRVTHLRRGLHYAEHLIFALHVHAFAFLAATAAVAIPDAALGGVEGPVVALGLLGYLYLAMRRMYARSRPGTLGAMLVVLPAYGFAMLVALVGALFVTLVV